MVNVETADQALPCPRTSSRFACGRLPPGTTRAQCRVETKVRCRIMLRIAGDYDLLALRAEERFKQTPARGAAR